MKKFIYGVMAAAIIIFAVPAGDTPETETVQTQSFSFNTSNDAPEQGYVTHAAARAMEAVVHITSIKHIDPSTNKYGAGTGSGYIVSDQGYIVTNCHVACDGAIVTVSTENGLLSENRADVVYASEPHDIAILKLRNLPEADLPVVTLNTEGVERGETVYAMGAPRGLKYTLTEGTVSAIRTIADYGLSRYGYIQTDTDINPGNSGGPLFVLRRGEMQVIGMNSFGLMPNGGSIGLNFAVNIKDVVDALASYAQNSPAYGYKTGLSVQTVAGGVSVRAVAANSPAALAGLERLDVITHINGEPVNSATALTDTVHRLGGDTLVVTYNRNGESQAASLTAISVWETPNPQPGTPYSGFTGLKVSTIPDAALAQLTRTMTAEDAEIVRGSVAIQGIANLSPAHAAKVIKGMGIYGVRLNDGTVLKTPTPEAFHNVVAEAYANDNRDISLIVVGLIPAGNTVKMVLQDVRISLKAYNANQS